MMLGASWKPRPWSLTLHVVICILLERDTTVESAADEPTTLLDAQYSDH